MGVRLTVKVRKATVKFTDCTLDTMISAHCGRCEIIFIKFG